MMSYTPPSAKAFQSTQPYGLRPPALEIIANALRFNPRSRTGCDGGLGGLATASGGFNPRSRTGCDHRAALLSP